MQLVKDYMSGASRM